MVRRNIEFDHRYRRLLNDIRTAIDNGTLIDGDYILPENTLSQKYELSRFSIRKAIAELVREGHIEKVAGLGNKVVTVKAAEHQQEMDSPLTLAWFASSFEIPIIKKMIATFEEQNPTLHVKLELLPESDYLSYLLQWIERDEGPDLFYLSDVHIQAFIGKQKLDHLSTYIPSHFEDANYCYSKVDELFRVDGQLRAVPFTFSPIVVVKNDRIWTESGLSSKLPLSLYFADLHHRLCVLFE